MLVFALPLWTVAKNRHSETVAIGSPSLRSSKPSSELSSASPQTQFEPHQGVARLLSHLLAVANQSRMTICSQNALGNLVRHCTNSEMMLKDGIWSGNILLAEMRLV